MSLPPLQPAPAPAGAHAVAPRLSFSRILERTWPGWTANAAGPLAASPEPWTWREPTTATRTESRRGVSASPLVVQVEAISRADTTSPVVELSVTRGLSLRVSRTDAGVAVVLEAAPPQTAPAHADLPRIVDALRARGIAVAQATVRTPSRRPRAR